MNYTRVECKIECDICGAVTAQWFGETSAAVCNNESCREEMRRRWHEHCEDIAAQEHQLD